MFCTTGMRESTVPAVELVGISAEVLSILVNFAYTAQLRVTAETVSELLPTAAMYHMSHVVHACCDFLQQQLNSGDYYSFISPVYHLLTTVDTLVGSLLVYY